MSATFPGYLVQTREWEGSWTTRLEGAALKDAWRYALEWEAFMRPGASLRMCDDQGVLIYQLALGRPIDPAADAERGAR
jgi:hypothetical protein